jgi:hypothetical protein
VSPELYGYLFIARDDLWTDRSRFRVGNSEDWERVKASEVEVGRPVLIGLSETGNPRLAGTGVVTNPPTGASEEDRNLAWVRYSQVFPPEFFRLPPANRDAHPFHGTWDNGQIDLLLGIRPPVAGGLATPFGVPAKTKIPISVGDAGRIRTLFPTLEW